MEHGAWSMEHGAWSTEHGAWNMEHGAWSMEPGAWSLEQVDTANYKHARVSHSLLTLDRTDQLGLKGKERGTENGTFNFTPRLGNFYKCEEHGQISKKCEEHGQVRNVTEL